MRIPIGVKEKRIVMLWFCTSVVVSAVFLGSWRLWSGNQQSNSWLIRRAISAFQQANLDEAIAYWQLSLEEQPQDPGLHYNLALALESAGDLSNATSEYERAIALNPVLATPRFNLAMIYLKQGKIEQAKGLLLEATEISPSFTAGHLFLARIYQGEGNVDLALAEIRKTLELGKEGDFDLAEVFFQKGVMLFNTGNLADAKGSFEDAMRLKPEYPEALRYLEKLPGNAASLR